MKNQMPVEIIIACRGELPENLRITTDSLKETLADGDKITIVLDGKQPERYNIPGCNIVQPWDEWRGPGACRDWAIMESKAKIVVLVDGHMTFPRGLLKDHIREHFSDADNAFDVTCCKMQALRHDWTPSPTESIYGKGCHLETIQSMECRKTWALNAVWNREPDPDLPRGGPVGALMGACYAMRRTWYKTMGQPLSILQAWGGDEEILSAVTWLCGGNVYLLPCVCGHIWAAPREPRGLNGTMAITTTEWRRMEANQYAILDALPIPAQEKQMLYKHLDSNNQRPEEARTIAARVAPAIARLQAAIKRQAKRVTWCDLREARVIREHVPPNVEKKESGAGLCKKCGAPALKPQGSHHPRCKKCGALQ